MAVLRVVFALSMALLITVQTGNSFECSRDSSSTLNVPSLRFLSGDLQLLIPEWRFNCKGTVTQWQARVLRMGNITESSLEMEFQAFKPDKEINDTLFHVVYGNSFNRSIDSHNESTISMAVNGIDRLRLPIDSGYVFGVRMNSSLGEGLFYNSSGGVDVYYWENNGSSGRSCDLSLCDDRVKVLRGITPLISWNFQSKESIVVENFNLNSFRDPSYCSMSEVLACSIAPIPSLNPSYPTSSHYLPSYLTSSPPTSTHLSSVVSSLWSPRSTRSVSTTTLLTALSSMMLRTPAIVSAISTKTSLPTTSQSALDRVHQSQILSTAYSLSSHSWLTLSASSILAHSSYPSNPVSTLSTQLSPEEHRLFTTLFSLVIGLLVLAIILTTILIIVFGMRCVKRCLAIKQENKRPVIRISSPRSATNPGYRNTIDLTQTVTNNNVPTVPQSLEEDYDETVGQSEDRDYAEVADYSVPRPSLVLSQMSPHYANTSPFVIHFPNSDPAYINTVFHF